MSAKHLLLLLVAFPTLGLTEGVLPVDLANRTVTTEHVTLQVSEAQELEMDSQQTLTLTPNQWQMLRKKGLMFPMRLEVVDYDADTCACALEGYTAIRLSSNTVGIPLSEAADDAKTVLEESKADNSLAMTVDRRGQFYADGLLIPYREVLSFFEKNVEPSSNKRAPQLSVWFPVDVDRASPAVKQRINEVEAAATKSGWEVDVQEKNKEQDSAN